MYHWFMLVLAIITEVISTLSMKLSSVSHPKLGFLIMVVMISISYLALARAVLRLPLVLTYAIWEGMGVVLVTLGGYWLFKEHLGPIHIIAIGLMLFGLALMTWDSETGQSKDKEEESC